MSSDSVPAFTPAEVVRELRRRKYECGIPVTRMALETGIDRAELWHVMAGRRLTPAMCARLTPYLAEAPVAPPVVEPPRRPPRQRRLRSLPIGLVRLPPGIKPVTYARPQPPGHPIPRVARNTLAHVVRGALLEYVALQLAPVTRREALAYLRGIVCPSCVVGAAFTAAANLTPGKRIPRARPMAACVSNGYPEPSTWLGLPPVSTASYAPSPRPTR